MAKTLRIAVLAFATAVFSIVSVPAAADDANQSVPNVVLSGIKAYKDSGPEAALKEWLKASPMEGSKDALAQSNLLRQIQAFYGEFVSYDGIQIHNVAPLVKVVYGVMNYKSGPLFARFVLFKPADGDWIIVQFNFHTKPEEVMPAQMLAKP